MPLLSMVILQFPYLTPTVVALQLFQPFLILLLAMAPQCFLSSKYLPLTQQKIMVILLNLMVPVLLSITDLNHSKTYPPI